jgi:Asp-tRNA(Asn)/Glu-tRNA(Gln) amidotransferase C subunit
MGKKRLEMEIPMKDIIQMVNQMDKVNTLGLMEQHSKVRSRMV